MKNIVYRTAILTDDQMFRALKDAADKHHLRIARIGLRLALWDGVKEMSIEAFEASTPINAIRAQNSVLFLSMNTTLTATEGNISIVVNVERPNDRTAHEQYRYSDGVTMSCAAPESNDNALTLYAATAATLRANLHSLDLPFASSSISDAAAKSHFERSEAEIAELKSLSLTLNRSLIERQDLLERSFLAKQEALDKKTNAEREALAAEHKRQMSILQEHEGALQARLNAVNDRDSKYERRRLHKEIQDVISNREKVFELTKGTRALRNPIRVTCFVLIGFSMLLISAYAVVLVKNGIANGKTPSDWFLAAKMFSLTMLLASTAVFYIRWENQWFRRHADEEFRLKSFALDIGRASWLVEMCLEWKKETQDVIPTHLLDQLSRNLFADREEPKEVPLHPSDQLASALLGTAAKVDLKLPGGELHLDRKDISKLKKAEIPSS